MNDTCSEALLSITHAFGHSGTICGAPATPSFASTRDDCLSPQVRLECNPEIPVAPGEEHWLLVMMFFGLAFLAVQKLWTSKA